MKASNHPPPNDGHRNHGLEVLSDAVLIMIGLYAEFSHVDSTGHHIIQFQLGLLVAPGATMARRDTCVRGYQSIQHSNQETMQRHGYDDCKLYKI